MLQWKPSNAAKVLLYTVHHSSVLPLFLIYIYICYHISRLSFNPREAQADFSLHHAIMTFS